MNLLALDSETAGLDPKQNGVIEIAYIIVAPDKTILAQGNITMNPGYRKTISRKALEVNGYELKDFKTMQSAKEATLKLYNDIRVHMGGSKFKVMGFNAKFDIAFLQDLFDTFLPYTYYKTFDYKYVDPFELIKVFQYLGIMDTGTSQNLESCAVYFGIHHTPHNCVSDIEATLKLWHILEDAILQHKDSLKAMLCASK